MSFVLLLAMAAAGAENERTYPAEVLDAWETEYNELAGGIKRRPTSENPAGLDLFKGGVRPPTPGASTPLMKKNEESIKRLWPEKARPPRKRRR